MSSGPKKMDALRGPLPRVCLLQASDSPHELSHGVLGAAPFPARPAIRYCIVLTVLVCGFSLAMFVVVYRLNPAIGMKYFDIMRQFFYLAPGAGPSAAVLFVSNSGRLLALRVKDGDITFFWPIVYLHRQELQTGLKPHTSCSFRKWRYSTGTVPTCNAPACISHGHTITILPNHSTHRHTMQTLRTYKSNE